MSFRTLSAFNVKANWPSSWGTSGTLVLTLDRSVVGSDSVEYPATQNQGKALSTLGFHFESAITVSTGTATCASISNLPTTDTVTPAHTAHYNIYLYDSKGRMREKLSAKPFHLHESVNGSSTSFTWEQWVVAQQFSQGNSQLPMIGDRVTMQAMVDAAIAGDRSALTGVPSTDYESLSAAVSSIGGVPTTLVVASSFASGNSTTVPSTLTLKFVSGGSLVLGSGHTVTINGPIIASPVQIFSGSGVVRFSSGAYIPVFRPQWWGITDLTGGTDNSAALQACLDALPSDSIIEFTQGLNVGLSSQITLTGKRNIYIRSANRAANYGGGKHATFTWLGSSGKMFYLDSCQGCTIDGFLFDIHLNLGVTSLDKFIDIDGTGSGGTISTANSVIYNSLNGGNQNTNSNFKAISISATSTTNNEHMNVSHNFIIGSGQTLLVYGTGSITNGTNALTIGGFTYSSTYLGRRIRVGLAGAAGITLDTTITGGSGTTVNLAANASATVSGVNVVIGSGYGVGIYNGPSANALHQTFQDNNISYCARGIDFRNGSGIVDDFQGVSNDIDVAIAGGGAEGYVVSNLRTESSIQGVVMTSVPSAPTFIFNSRGSNTAQLTEGWMVLDGIVTLQNSAWYSPPPVGGKLIADRGTGNLRFLSICNNYTTSDTNTVSLATAGFPSLSSWCSIYDVGLIGNPLRIICGQGDPSGGATTSAGHILKSDYSVYSSTLISDTREAATAANTLLLMDEGIIERYGLFRPNSPLVTKIGTHGGSASYTFVVVAVDASGNRSLRSGTYGIANVANTLSASNYLKVDWPATPGASTYELYVQNPSSSGEAELLASGIATNTYNVTSNPSAGPYTAWSSLVPAANEGALIRYRGGEVHNSTAVLTANYAVKPSDQTIFGDTSGGAFTVTLPAAAASNKGREIEISQIGTGANVLTVSGNGTNINGAATYTGLSAQYKVLCVKSTGSIWLIVYSN